MASSGGSVGHDGKTSAVALSSNSEFDRALMPPPKALPVYRKDYVKGKKVVLEEEEFVNALELIIERDFFPETSKLRALHGAVDGSLTGAVSDAILANKDIRLDKFIGKYTSEDNQSFEELHAKDLQERRKQLPWLYEPEDSSEKAGLLMLYYMDNRKITAQERQEFDRLLKNSSDDTADSRKNGIEPWRFRVRNQLMFPPELGTSEEICRVNDTSSHAAPAIPGWTGNPLLGWDESNNPTAKAHASTGSGNEFVGKVAAKEKQIVHENTRLFENPKAARKVISGFDFSPLEPPHTPSVYSEDSSSSVREEGGVKAYRTVPMTPLIVPGATASPLMTWGDIAGTPLILDRSQHCSSSSLTAKSPEYDSTSILTREAVVSDRDARFEIKPASKRESIAREMSATKKRQPISLSAPSNITPIGKRHRTQLTPAAQALADRLKSVASRGPTTPFGGSMEQINRQKSSSCKK